MYAIRNPIGANASDGPWELMKMERDVESGVLAGETIAVYRDEDEAHNIAQKLNEQRVEIAAAEALAEPVHHESTDCCGNLCDAEPWTCQVDSLGPIPYVPPPSLHLTLINVVNIW